MLKRFLFVVLMWVSLSYAAFGQSTTVSGTITDAGGQAWANGTYRIQFNPNGAAPPYQWNGTPFVPGSHVFSGSLNSSGAFSGLSIPSNTSIGPGTMWAFTLCPASSSPCYTTSIIITGTTQSVTANIIPPAIVVNANTYNQPTAYADSEISGPTLGFTYFNLTDQTNHTCTVSVPCTWASGGGSSGSNLFSAMVFLPGVGTNAMLIYRDALPQAIVFPSGATSSYAIAGTAATASTVYTFKKNGSSFATATFAISGTTATWTQASNSTFAAGDVLEIDGPATADATLADVGITLVGTKQ